MPPLSKTEQEHILNEISQSLSETPYACSTLTQLNGGTVSFVYRGLLRGPLEDGSKGIIVKKTPNHVAINRDFLLDAGRCVFEAAILKALSSKTLSSVETPILYDFNSSTNTQILQDFPTSKDIKSFLMSPTTNYIFTPSLSLTIGKAAGSWLKSFHDWSLVPEQVELRKFVKGNEAMQKLKFDVTYGGFINVLSNFPDILGDKKDDLERISQFVKREWEEKSGHDEWGIIHGDFWSGNVLMSWQTTSTPGITELQVIDFEFAQLGHPSHDLGQMIGDLIERNHFHDLEAALWILKGFLEGYGDMSEELTFRTAIHAGIHLICFYTRRPPTGPVKGTKEQIEGAMRMGLEFILKGWEKDRGWFEESVLKALFVKRSTGNKKK